MNERKPIPDVKQKTAAAPEGSSQVESGSDDGDGDDNEVQFEKVVKLAKLSPVDEVAPGAARKLRDFQKAVLASNKNHSEANVAQVHAKSYALMNTLLSAAGRKMSSKFKTEELPEPSQKKLKQGNNSTEVGVVIQETIDGYKVVKKNRGGKKNVLAGESTPEEAQEGKASASH